jgi:hypothetical protein
MPWKCPNCCLAITHLPAEMTPQSDKIYRCPVCKRELIFDADKGRLVLAPIDEPDQQNLKHA